MSKFTTSFSKPNQKGFTLFSIVITIGVFVIAVLLVSSMVAKEESYNKIVQQLRMSERQNTIADLARADALQTMNLAIRNDLQSTLENLRYEIDYRSTFQDLVYLDSQTQKGIVPYWFNKSVITSHVATGVRNFLQTYALGTGQQFEGYDIFIIYPQNRIPAVLEEGQEPESVFWSEILAKSISEEGVERIVAPKDCDSDECDGTFYLVVDTRKLTEDAYLKLPKLHISSFSEQSTAFEAIEKVILPKGRHMIYVPVRLFKAVALAQNYAQNYRNARTSQGWNNWQLGMCEKNKCSPESSIKSSATPSEWSYFCPGSSGWNEQYDSIQKTYGNIGYDPSNIVDIQSKFVKDTENEICNIPTTGVLHSSIELQTSQNCNIDKSLLAGDIRLLTKPSKIIVKQPCLSAQTINQMNNFYLNPQGSRLSPASERCYREEVEQCLIFHSNEGDNERRKQGSSLNYNQLPSSYFDPGKNTSASVRKSSYSKDQEATIHKENHCLGRFNNQNTVNTNFSSIVGIDEVKAGVFNPIQGGYGMLSGRPQFNETLTRKSDYDSFQALMDLGHCDSTRGTNFCNENGFSTISYSSEPYIQKYVDKKGGIWRQEGLLALLNQSTINNSNRIEFKNQGTVSGFPTNMDIALEEATLSSCAKLEQIKIPLKFEETDSRYKIDKNKELVFTLIIKDDTYTDFNGKFNSIDSTLQSMVDDLGNRTEVYFSKLRSGDLSECSSFLPKCGFSSDPDSEPWCESWNPNEDICMTTYDKHLTPAQGNNEPSIGKCVPKVNSSEFAGFKIPVCS